ncbi:MAG TPA: MBL fold metallo-hydrolase, partial [Egibacteraceae bacterium]|nr:MBL fold metallo-hydrolase [Egibacteraceae bacterium]
MTATQLDELTSVVLAPNPSPMTLEGTNTYLVGAPGAGDVVVVDPGPHDDGHRGAVEAEARRRDAQITAVVVTHHHRDHAEAVPWAQAWGAELLTYAPELLPVPAPASPLRDDAAVRRAGVTLTAVHTPGHASDHLCLRVDETGAVLTGDHVLGRGTTVVAWPDGDMAAYMASLRRLERLDASVLYPGHGPVVRDPAAVVADYIAHREARELQVLAALAAGDTTPAAIVARVYAAVDPVLHPAAERSVRAHLAKLVTDGTIVQLVDPSVNEE